MQAATSALRWFFTSPIHGTLLSVHSYTNTDAEAKLPQGGRREIAAQEGTSKICQISRSQTFYVNTGFSQHHL